MTTSGQPSDDTLPGSLAAERRRAAELEHALETSRRIGMAMGIVMERYGIEPDAAFAVLQRHSQAGNVKLRDIADQLVRTGELPSGEDAGRLGADDEVVPRPRG
ncbi:ANTAR domain-containing protein [Blastococcus goldschmidtiae]|uniref:ANTAR domain-containing protein n=1 Tax=Blastococcus goldschmidtiae TaxID=3075546 RepID=A0ABU2K7Q7_9ACTN|nr:ANTAR domain-containing protein [Blastococcus sp. DSM 46792]MDT0276214.1 ANTAR domain-containing protein [Blastococcus sp. DSM 46792]